MVWAGSAYSGSVLISATWATVPVTIDRPDRLPRLGGEVVVRGQVHQPSVEANDETVDGRTEPRGARRNRLECRLDVGRGAADDAEDLAGRRLLLQRLGEVAVARLQ